jgi:hypothetical protein
MSTSTLIGEYHIRSTLLARCLPALLLAGALAACGSDESPSGTEDHTPATYTVLVNGTETQPPFTLVEGQAVSVQLKFFNAEEEDLDIVEDTHFAGLTFSPTNLATVTRDPDHNYRFTVTGETVGIGTVQVSHGHDAAADETTFTPVPATVAASD